MKKTFLLIIFAGLLYTPDIHAQFSKGKVLLGLSTRMGLYDMASSTSTDIFSLGFTSIKHKSDADGYEEPEADKFTSFNLMPRVGFFLVDNFALGLDFSYTSLSYKDGTDDDKSSISTFGAGPFIRYYFPVEKVSPFVEGDLIFGSSKSKWEPSGGETNESKTGLFAWGAGLGVAFPLGDVAALDLLVGYNSYSQKDKEDNENNNRTVMGTFGVKFGFLIFLGKGSE